MERKRKLAVAKAVVILGAIPILLWAYEYGPDPGHVGIPSENGGATCATSGCHTGTANDPTNKGSVTVAFPNGLTYVPGVTQELSVTVADPATSQQAYGFQLTARLHSNASTMAGSFVFTDSTTVLMCANPANLQNDFQPLCNSASIKGCSLSTTGVCPARMTAQYMEHSYSGYLASLSPPHNGSYTYRFNWTPPPTNVGTVDIWVAGNAGVGGPPSEKGDHIYTNKYTLTPSAGGPLPAISSAGVVNGASFQPGVVPNSWITIQGTNLALATDTWEKAIVNGKLPTTLDGVTVTVGGQPAFVYFISPNQINALAPNIGTGSVSVTVATPNGSSTAVTAVSASVSPAFFSWPNGQPVATHSADNSWAVKNGTFAGTTTVPAKPGEAIILWGTGFGPANPAAPVGVQVPSDKIYYTAAPVTVTINGTAAAVYATALSPGYAGLYQVVVTVPPGVANGDFPLVATIDGAQSPVVTLSVHN
jgi:uncharacterized protein (TIGR03437 family)